MADGAATYEELQASAEMVEVRREDLRLLVEALGRSYLKPSVNVAYQRLERALGQPRPPTAHSTAGAAVAAGHWVCPGCGQPKDDAAFPTCRKRACIDGYARGR